MMPKLALIGCGKHMQKTLVPYLLQLEGYEVAVCVDSDEVSVKRVMQMSHAKTWASNIEDIDLPSIDATFIAVPANEAYKVTRYFLQHDIACFVEKPPASTTQEINALLQIAQTRNTYVQVGFNFRYTEAMRELYSCIATYGITPYIAHIEFRSKHPSGPEWGRVDPVAAWMYHNGVHALDLLQWTLGSVQQVQANILRTDEGKFIIVALIKHLNGSLSTIKMGNITDKFDLRMEVFTSNADQFYMPHLGEVVLSQRRGKVAGEVLYRTPNLDNGWGRSGYGPELKHFLQNYQHPEYGSPSLLDALRASQLCDAIMLSVQTETSREVASALNQTPIEQIENLHEPMTTY